MPDPDLGCFGKIPGAGDFLAWTLPRAFTAPWDRAISAELAARPDQGPLDPRAWRFLLPGGALGPLPAAGIWRMSADRAGRRYPFLIARTGPPPDPAWFDAVEPLLAGAVAQAWPPPTLRAALAALPPPATAVAPAPDLRFWHGSTLLRFADADELTRGGFRAMRAAETR